VKAENIGLSPGMSVDAGIKTILGLCLHHALSNVRGILHEEDPEYVHQMRVGLRRFRSACKLFSSWLRLPPHIESELEWIGGMLGSLRDLDVLTLSTLPDVRRHMGDENDLQSLLARAGAAAAEHRAALRRALHSPRFGQWMVALLEWIDMQRWHEGLDEKEGKRLQRPLDRFAREAVERGHGRIEKRGRKIDPKDNARVHRLRIACKRQRYAVEFFHDFERNKFARSYLKRTTGLQDLIGARVDLAVARRLVCEMRDDVPDLAEPADLAAGYLARLGRGKLRGVRHDWKALTARSPTRLFQAKGK
jgi:CHAD domain-containing protein